MVHFHAFLTVHLFWFDRSITGQRHIRFANNTNFRNNIMHYELPLLGLAIYLLFWDKLPSWGTWFNRILDKMPGFIKYLYKCWNCAYCSGFWIALALHWATGIWFIDQLQTLPSFWVPLDGVVGCFLDALAAATVIYVAKTFIDLLKAANSALGNSCRNPS
jgi:hypothetical protein